MKFPCHRDSSKAHLFATVLTDELDEIARRRGNITTPGDGAPNGGQTPTVLNQRRRAQDLNLLGLACSGGGIRSATFGLGVLQGLANFGLLTQLDYLSTVSGGGYIGSWLSAWIHRAGGIEKVQPQLRESRLDQAANRSVNRPVTPQDEEPEPIFHLRSFSNYLTPRVGWNSADTWVAVAIYARNVLLNQLILVPVLFAVVFLIRLGVAFYVADQPFGGNSNDWLLYLGGVCLLSFAVLLAFGLSDFRRAAEGALSNRSEKQFGARLRYFKYFSTYLFLATAIVGCWFLGSDDRLAFRCDIGPAGWRRWALLGAITGSVLTLGVFAAARLRYWCLTRKKGGPNQASAWKARFGLLTVAAALCGAAIGGLTWLVVEHFPLRLGSPAQVTLAQRAAILWTFGPPLVLVAFTLCSTVMQAAVGRLLKDAELEWHGSVAGWMLAVAYRWLGLVTVVIFSVPAVDWIVRHFPSGAWSLAGGWIATSISGLIAGQSPATGRRGNRSGRELLAQLAPYVFMLGLVIALSWIADRTVAWSQTIASETSQPVRRATASSVGEERPKSAAKDNSNSYWLRLAPGLKMTRSVPELPDQSLPTAAPFSFSAINASSSYRFVYLNLGIIFGCCVIAGLTSFLVGVNTFSLQSFYRNRLIRCFLGASLPKSQWQTETLRGAPAPLLPEHETKFRQPDSVTGLFTQDDLPLESFVRPDGATVKTDSHYGPYHLINTALNLVQGDELAWQERKAEAFVLSPLYCGSRSTGFRKTADYAGGLSLGTAVAISGAAVSPNMGYHSSPTVSAFLTLFNLRLGAWLGNPRGSAWRIREPRNTLSLLFKEVFGRTNRHAAHVYLSDGGHFENLGVYELVRRHCRFIVALDAGADPTTEFSDLGGLIRKCRSDFGVPIEIDVEALRPSEETRYSRQHCAVGLIRYDLVDSHAAPGIFLYIKATLTGDEPADVRNYALRHASFPHQPTSDQWFSESQFEAYRALGQHIAQEVFTPALREELRGEDPLGFVANLFTELSRRWSAAPTHDDASLNANEDFIRMVQTIRTDPQLTALSNSLYADVLSPASVSLPQERAELHAVSQMIQVLENAWNGAQLDRFSSHGSNLGWANLGMRWLRSAPVQRYWPVLRGEYHRDFVRYCERDLGAPASTVRLLNAAAHLVAADPDLVRLSSEFQTEWPRRSMIDNAATLRDQLTQLQSANESLLYKIQLQWRGGGPICIGAIRLTHLNESQLEAEMWLGGAFRGLGLGADAWRELEQALTLIAGRYSELVVRYPRLSGVTTRGNQSRRQWKRFFQRVGFIQPETLPGPDEELVLTRSFPK